MNGYIFLFASPSSLPPLLLLLLLTVGQTNVAVFGYREPAQPAFFPQSRQYRQISPMVAAPAAVSAMPVFVPIAAAAVPSGPSLNDTANVMDEKLKSAKGDFENTLDDKLKRAKDSASADFDVKLEAARNKSGQEIDAKLSEESRRLADSVAKSESSVQSKLNALQDENKKHLTEVSDSMLAQNKNSSEKLNLVLEKLSRLSELTSGLVDDSRNFCRTGETNLTLSSHHEKLHEEYKAEHERLLDAIRVHLDESLSKVKMENEHEKKVRKDDDIKRNIDVRIEVPDEENPAIGKLLPLTPIVTARKLRQIWNSQMGKGMVSVCYHNQPRPLAEEHPLVENDDPLIQSIFNGTMDSAHNLQAGLNLDTPAYINSLLMEVRSLDRQYVSLCLEDPDHDVEFYHRSACMNLVITRKS